jgi:hypothetical protein
MKDKEGGRVKSVTPSAHGVKVEMYSADDAARDLLRIHGAYEKDKEPPAVNINIGYGKEE